MNMNTFWRWKQRLRSGRQCRTSVVSVADLADPGCNDLVAKPYSPHQLLAKIRNYLQ